MKVLFDVTSLLTKTLDTDGIYTKNLYRLLRSLGVDVDPVYRTPRGIKENYISHHIKGEAKKLMPFFASKGAILHGPSGNLISESNKFKKVLSVNDMSMFRDGLMAPNLASQLQAHLKQQVQSDVAAILTPSYEVHNEFLVRFPKMVSRVHVAIPGCDHILDISNSHEPKLINSPYFLFVGTVGKKSNLAGVLKAFSGFCAIQKSVQLVVVGDNGYGAEAIHKMLSGSAIQERVTLFSHKGDARLKQLYAGAIATVIPSYYEGFSFPMVESMKMGCPVITSTVGSMKEIGADGVHLVNPKDTEQIMGGMERVYADRVYRDKLIRNGQETTQTMSWLNCAKKITEIYSGL